MNIIKSINPSTKKVLGEVKITSKEEIVKKVQQARSALRPWNDLGVSGRVRFLRKIISGLIKRKDEFAELATKEMGMPINQSLIDIDGAVEYFEWYLDNAEKYLAPEITYENDQQIHTVYHEPTGVAAAITPWNFPASNFVWMCGQNLVVGNTIVFKHSEEIPLCGKLIEEIVTEANLPGGVFCEVYGGAEVGSVLVDQDIDMICFTGSTATGQTLYKKAAEKFIKVFLELGGSAPGIIFEDADIDKVLDVIYSNRFSNCGQICDGLKRLIVHENVYEKVLIKLKKKLANISIGDASQNGIDMGPLVSEKQLETLKLQVEDAKQKGARIEFEYKLPNDLDGYFYPPTIISNVKPDMDVWKEEVFGPVLPIVTFKTEEEAIDKANDTKYGLGGYIFTEDQKKAKRVSLQIKSGMIQHNNASYITPSDPFGGCKLSGIGREHGKFGFYDLSQVKIVSLQK